MFSLPFNKNKFVFITPFFFVHIDVGERSLLLLNVELCTIFPLLIIIVNFVKVHLMPRNFFRIYRILVPAIQTIFHTSRNKIFSLSGGQYFLIEFTDFLAGLSIIHQ